MSWLTQFFLNPGFVLPGAALASVPIIIHLLSRLRYKRVRFAAMEFLLQSDELNRRRLIIEQLLLLFLRVLAVVLIVLLLARLVLDPSRLMMLRGATTHHVIIIDDSLSMRESAQQDTRFKQAVGTLERLLNQAAGSTAALQLTVLTTTTPGRPLVTDRSLDNALLQELNPRLRNLTCSWKATTPVAALEAAYNILAGDPGVTPQVHVLTDLRQSDWTGQPDVVSALDALDTIEARVNLIQVAASAAENVALTEMTTSTSATAVGVPWRLNLTFHNFSSRKVSGQRATVFVDGVSLPARVLLPDIEPESDGKLSHDIVFEAPGQHEVEVRLEQDALTEDNSRYAVVDVTDQRNVLIIDDDARQEDARYVAAALSADQLSAQIRQSDVLLSEVLDPFDYIYLLNIRELPADATLLLADYVSDGGGIVWFPDDQANTTWYNTDLHSKSTPLFPVELSTVAAIPAPVEGEDPQFQTPVFEKHPVFAFYDDTPFASDVHVSSWYQVAEAGTSDTATGVVDAPGVETLARLSNGDPIIFEHSFGKGRILTWLTTAGKRWTNWPVLPAAPGFVVTNLLMHQYLQKPVDNIQIREVGDLIRLEWPVSEFTESVEVFQPEAEEDAASTFLRLQAAPVVTTDTADNVDAPAAEERLAVTLNQAERPGIYRIKRFRQEGETHETWMALSVPASESDLAIADAKAVEQQAEAGHVRVVSAEVAGELAAGDAGRELRRLLLLMLVLVLIGEQLLSLRLSFHPEVKS